MKYITEFETTAGRKLVTTVTDALGEVYGTDENGQVLHTEKAHWARTPAMQHVQTLIRNGGIRAAWCAIWHHSFLDILRGDALMTHKKVVLFLKGLTKVVLESAQGFWEDIMEGRAERDEAEKRRKVNRREGSDNGKGMRAGKGHLSVQRYIDDFMTPMSGDSSRGTVTGKRKGREQKLKTPGGVKRYKQTMLATGCDVNRAKVCGLGKSTLPKYSKGSSTTANGSMKRLLRDWLGKGDRKELVGRAIKDVKKKGPGPMISKSLRGKGY